MVVVLLAATLVVTSVLAWHAYEASQSHTAVARRVLRDYVEFASWQFSQAAERQLDAAVYTAVNALACPLDCGPRLPDAKTLAGVVEKSGTSWVVSPSTFFRLDIDPGTLWTTGTPPGDGMREWLKEASLGVRTASPLHTGPLLKVARFDGVTVAVAFGLITDQFGAPRALYGFVSEPKSLGSVFKTLVKHTPLLPPTLTGGETDNSALAIKVTGEGNAVVFDSTGPPKHIASTSLFEEPFIAKGGLGGRHGGLWYSITLRSEAAARLVIGGLPQSRVPLLLGLLGLTAGLIVVAVVQLRRESEFSRRRSDFVSSVSHELRTPLAQIRMFSETLLLGRVRSDDEARRSLEIIQQESQRLTHLVENVLHYSRGERGVDRVVTQPIALVPLLRELVEAFGPLARSRRVTFALDADGEVVAMADPAALRQILLNLLDNAVKYGPPGQTVVTSMRVVNGAVRLAVDDEGPGIAADDRERIWEPFRRSDRHLDSAVAGTGIGLAVVRDLTRLHSGRVWVEAAPRGGARFVVELPGVVRIDGPDKMKESRPLGEPGMPA